MEWITIDQRLPQVDPSDPCDVWPVLGFDRPYSVRLRSGHPSEAVTLENWTPQDALAHPGLIPYLRELRTDFSRWAHETSWTVEGGPDDAPFSVDVEVPYSYSGGSSDFFAGGCWNPGDSAECEAGTAWFINDHGERVELVLLEAEAKRVEQWIMENPPEPDYDYDC